MELKYDRFFAKDNGELFVVCVNVKINVYPGFPKTSFTMLLVEEDIFEHCS